MPLDRGDFEILFDNENQIIGFYIQIVFFTPNDQV